MQPCQTPTDIAVDPRDGSVFVADGSSCLIRYATSGTPEAVAGDCGHSGNAGDGGLPLDALMASVSSVDVDEWGNVYIADRTSNVVRVIVARATGLLDIE
jgi:hypothetical protein